MLGSCDDRLLHVAILDSDDIGATLLLIDKTGATLESAMGHAHLLATIKNDGDAVSFLIFVEDAADAEASALVLVPPEIIEEIYGNLKE